MERWVGEKNLGELGGGKKSWNGRWVGEEKKTVKGRCLKQALQSWVVGKNLGEVGG